MHQQHAILNVKFDYITMLPQEASILITDYNSKLPKLAQMMCPDHYYGSDRAPTAYITAFSDDLPPGPCSDVTEGTYAKQFRMNIINSDLSTAIIKQHGVITLIQCSIMTS